MCRIVDSAFESVWYVCIVVCCVCISSYLLYRATTY